ncbi:hypothetical protein [Lysobacter gummosus]
MRIRRLIFRERGGDGHIPLALCLWCGARYCRRGGRGLSSR